MTSESRTSTPPDDAPRLIQALESYRDAIESGRFPDRVALLAAHPEIREVLETCLSSLAFLRDAAPRFVPTCLDSPPPLPEMANPQADDVVASG